MQNLSIVRTGDVPRDARLAVENLLGRAVADDEKVGIWASSPHGSPSGEAKRQARDRLREQLNSMASKATGIEDLERLADEIATDVRHPRQ